MGRGRYVSGGEGGYGGVAPEGVTHDSTSFNTFKSLKPNTFKSLKLEKPGETGSSGAMKLKNTLTISKGTNITTGDIEC
jgi:hypothetical protein